MEARHVDSGSRSGGRDGVDSGPIQKDIDRLEKQGKLLEIAMVRETNEESFSKSAKAQLGNAAEEFLKKLPVFREDYESWYSEALALLTQILPERVQNFRELYDKPKNRKDIDFENYVIQDYLQGLRVTRAGEILVGPNAAVPRFRQQLAILKATRARFESSLFELRHLLQADLFDDEIESARELLKNGFLRAAGAVAGVVLEKHLRQVCADHKIKVAKKNPGINDLNELLKANSVIEVPQWRFISMLGDIRNLCDHIKSSDPTKSQVHDLIEGTNKILKTLA